MASDFLDANQEFPEIKEVLIEHYYSLPNVSPAFALPLEGMVSPLVTVPVVFSITSAIIEFESFDIFIFVRTLMLIR